MLNISLIEGRVKLSAEFSWERKIVEFAEIKTHLVWFINSSITIIENHKVLKLRAVAAFTLLLPTACFYPTRSHKKTLLI